MGKFNDLTGKKFGHLTVLKRIGTYKNGCAIWLVKCKCKNEIEVIGSRLTNKKQPMIHCGCLTSKNCSNAKKTHGQSYKKAYQNEENSRYRIKHRSLSGTLPGYKGSIKKSRDELNYCVYCGSTDSLSTDHIISIKKGGNNDFQNLITACLSCNCGKGSSFFIDWYLKTDKVKRSLSEIISDMGFDSINHLQNYQNVMCPDYVEENRPTVFAKLLRAERKSIRSLDRYYRSLDHYPTH